MAPTSVAPGCRPARAFVFAALAAIVMAMPVGSQTPPQQPPAGEEAPQPPRPTQQAQAAKAAAPIDLTGYWVSLITDDWRWRMVTPPKGDYLYLPLNAEGRKVADTWDPAKDEAAGEACRGYGAVHVMRLPGRLHITWQDDNTMKLETDAGTQTRTFQFGAGRQGAEMTQRADVEPSWQGHSVATWEFDGRPARGRGAAAQAQPRRHGSLKVVTTRMKPGYLRKNGVPYSGNSVLTEYFARITEPNGDEYLVVTTMLEDPQYLNAPYVRSGQFRKQPDATGWNPTPCSAR